MSFVEQDDYGPVCSSGAVELISGIETMRALRESGKTQNILYATTISPMVPVKFVLLSALIVHSTVTICTRLLVLSANPLHDGERITATPRIGIIKNANALRVYRGEPFVSK